jgi:uncharacterized membrane protein
MGSGMTIRNRTTVIMLWICILSWSVWVGGTIFNEVICVPAWSASPPESLRSFLAATNFTGRVGHIFGLRWAPLRFLPLLVMLISGWRLPLHRKYFVIAAICMFAGLVYTLTYIYPLNRVLFGHAGAIHTAAELQAIARHWIFADRLRLGISSVGYLALLRALSIPIPTDS